MITKIVVNKDNIDLYQDKDVVLTVPNTEKNTELPRLFNNMVFATKDVMLAERKHKFIVSKLTKSALFAFAFTILTAINLGTISSIALFLVFYQVLKFMANRKNEKEAFRLLNSYQNKANEIREKIQDIKENPGDEKSDTYSLEFTDDQMTIDHSIWVKEIGDSYDYQGDLDTIRNSKVMII